MHTPQQLLNDPSLLHYLLYDSLDMLRLHPPIPDAFPRKRTNALAIFCLLSRR